MKKKFLAISIAVLMTLCACTTQLVQNTETQELQDNVSEVSKLTTNETTSKANEDTTLDNSYDDYDTITFGLVAAQSGSGKTIGQFVINGAELAIEEINSNGGLLGKQVELIIEDEGENAQSAVNATNKILNYENVCAVIGSIGSSNCLAVSPAVAEKEIPYMAGGSSANIPLEENPWMWQNRMTDDQSGQIMAKAAVETLEMKNPAIMFSTESFGTGLKDQTISSLKLLGIEVDENNVYGFNADEKQFQPIFTQIQNSDVDGIIAVCHTNPASIIVLQAADAGIDLPCLGSNAFSSIVCRQSAGEIADGWYSVTDWTAEGQIGRGLEFAEAYEEKYKEESDLVAVAAYDQVYLLSEAIKISNSAVPNAINEGLSQIQNYEGAMSTYTYSDTHCLSTSQALTINENVKAILVDKITLD